MIKKLNFAALGLLVGACAGPIDSQSSRVDTISSIAVQNAPEGAILAVGSFRTRVDAEGIASVNVPDGWHDAEVLMNGRPVITRRVFVQDGSAKIIEFNAP